MLLLLLVLLLVLVCKRIMFLSFHSPRLITVAESLFTGFHVIKITKRMLAKYIKAAGSRKADPDQLLALNKRLLEEKTLLQQQIEISTYMLESFQEGIVECDCTGRVTFVNSTMKELFSLEDMSGQDITELTQNIDINIQAPDITLTERIQSFRRGSPSWKNFETVYFGGKDHLFSVYLNPVTDTGQTVSYGFMLVLRSCTEEQRTNKMRKDMIGVVSHELKTPLSTMLGYIEIMMKYDIPLKTRKHYMGIILGEINWLSNLLEDYLSSERMEAGWHVYHKTYMPLVELIRQVAEQWNQKSSHQIHVSSGVEDVFVYADQNRITQVFHNLISNAIKYSPGKDRVDIEIQAEEKFLVVNVRDYGMGVPQNLYDRLFEKFYRIDLPKYRQITGTGLGLYITKKIVEDHGGQISVTSLMGQGTMFKLTIPTPDKIE